MGAPSHNSRSTPNRFAGDHVVAASVGDPSRYLAGMTDKTKGPPKATTDRDVASRSGIPLQRHLAALVRKAHEENTRQRWSVEVEECRAGDGFIDMILLTKAAFTTRLAVEVKRFIHSKEDRPMRLVFLAPSRETRVLNAPWIVSYVDPASRSKPAMQHHLFAGECYSSLDWRTCKVAEHCCPEERSGSTTFDDIVRELVDQMQALSFQAIGSEPYAFLPVIVTNADLRILRIGDVDLRSGVPSSGEEQGEQVKWLRYEKTISRTGLWPVDSPAPANDLGEWAAERLRTAVVVQSEHFIEFLTSLALATEPWK